LKVITLTSIAFVCQIDNALLKYVCCQATPVTIFILYNTTQHKRIENEKSYLRHVACCNLVSHDYFSLRRTASSGLPQGSRSWSLGNALSLSVSE
jgi:hypothetical protein